jgi:integrase/recombinase XerC
MQHSSRHDLVAPMAIGEMSALADKGVASVAGYLKYAKVTKRLATRTLELYAHGLAQLERLASDQSVALLDIQHSHIRRWMASQHSQGLAPRTLAVQLSSWRGFFGWLVLQGHSLHNPCIGIKAPKADKPLPKALGVDAAMALVQYGQDSGSDTTPLSARADISPTSQGQTNSLVLPLRSRGDVAKRQGGSSDLPNFLSQLITELLYGSGLRVSELVGLDIAASAEAMESGRGWIDAASAEVHVFGKGSKRRMVPLGSKAAQALMHYLPERSAQLVSLGKDAASQPALLLSPKGVRLTRQAVWGLLRVRSLAAGLDTPVHPHMLRHSFASHVLQSSGDLRAVQELLGHSSIASTQVYTRLDFQHLAKIYDNSHPRAKLSKENI